MIEHYYQDVPGYFDFPEVYRQAVESIPDGGTFVEVGCWQGQSLAYFLVEAYNSGKRINVYGVDHFRGSVGDGPLIHMAGSKDIGSHCLHHLRRAVYPFALVCAESVAGRRFFADGSLDYVFIDGSHDGESVAADLKAWIPKVRTGGIAAGHDYNQGPVKKAVDAAFIGKTVEHINNVSAKWGTCWRVQL